MINDDELVDSVAWPKNKFTACEIRALLSTVRIFIDFDGVLTDDNGTPRGILLGKPIGALLDEQPFVVQTWNPQGAIQFFNTFFPRLPKPVMIIEPPHFIVSTRVVTINGEREEQNLLGKDFEPLNVHGATIIDDWARNGRIHAPDCVAIKP